MTVRVCAIGQMELRVHPLTVLVLAGACVLGRIGALLQAMLALSLHEAAHAVVANVFCCRIDSVELQPFGGVARMREAGLTPHAERCIALAGPVASFVIAGVTAVVCDIVPAVADRMQTFLSCNLTLGLINLLPALSLDGGRVARSLMSQRFAAAVALRVTAWTGIATGVGMLALFIVATVRGAYNLTLPVMGFFLLLAAAGELKMAQERRLAAFLHKSDALLTGGMRVHLVAVSPKTPAREALRMLRDNRFNLLRIVDGRMRCIGELDEGALVLGMARLGASAHVADILSFDRKERI